MTTFYSPKGRRNSHKTTYVPIRAYKLQLKVDTFNWIVVLKLAVSVYDPGTVSTATAGGGVCGPVFRGTGGSRSGFCVPNGII